MKAHIFVTGKPVPQGSMRGFANKHTGKVGVTNSNASALGMYRADIQYGWDVQVPLPKPTDGPVKLQVTFYFARPKWHYNAKGELIDASYTKGPAPHYVTGKPDLDKLVRSVCDALTQRAFLDDDQVVRIDRAEKVYASRCYTSIRVADMWEDD